MNPSVFEPVGDGRDGATGEAGALGEFGGGQWWIGASKHVEALQGGGVEA